MGVQKFQRTFRNINRQRYSLQQQREAAMQWVQFAHDSGLVKMQIASSGSNY